MSKETECKELQKNRAYVLTVGDVEISALKLEGFKAIQLGGTVSPINVGVGGSKVEGDDWLVIVKNKDNIAMPYQVWAQQVANELSKATGSTISSVSVVSGDIKVETSEPVGLVDKLKVTLVKGEVETKEDEKE